MSGEQGALTAPAPSIETCASPLKLSFEEFNRRIDALPEGPISVLNAPRWQRVLNTLGCFPLLGIAALRVSLAMEWVEPAMWMVTFLQCAIAVMVLFWMPWLLRSIWVMGNDFRKGTAGFMQQWDHDMVQFEHLQDWLSQFPAGHLEERLLQCRQLTENMQRRLGLFFGLSDRWGILPALVAVFFLLQDQKRLLELPGWMIVLGIAIPMCWVIAMKASRARLRLAVMADLLEGALRREVSR